MRMRARARFGGGFVAEGDAVDRVQVGDRLLVRELDVRHPGGPDGEPGLHLNLVVIDGVPQCESVTVHRIEGGRGVRRADLRAVPIEDLLEVAFAMTAYEAVVDDDGQVYAQIGERTTQESVRVVREARAQSRQRITPEVLQEVAEVYRANVGKGPARAVARHFGVSPRTGSEYARRARREGYLDATDTGGRPREDDR